MREYGIVRLLLKMLLDCEEIAPEDGIGGKSAIALFLRKKKQGRIDGSAQGQPVCVCQ